MNNVASFDMMALAAAAKRATETIAQIKHSRDNVDLAPVQECGHMMRRLLTKESAAFNTLDAQAHEVLSNAAGAVDARLNTRERVRNLIGEVVGTTRCIATISDPRAIERAETFLLKLAS